MKKYSFYIFISLFIFRFSCVNAQVIQISDTNFLSKLVKCAYCATFNDKKVGYADKNRNGKLEKSEAEAIISLRLDSGQIQSIDEIHHFTSLKHLTCSRNKLQQLLLNHNKELETLDCSYNQISNINLQGLIYLRILNIEMNSLQSFDWDGLHSLTDLFIYHNLLDTIDLAKYKDLRVLYCGGNKIRELYVPINSKLEFLDCGSKELIHLDITQASNLIELSAGWSPKLEKVDLRFNPFLELIRLENCMISNLDLSGSYSLKYLSVEGNLLEELIIPKLNQINEISCANNKLTELRVKHLKSLEKLFCSGNKIEQLDVSFMPNLKDFVCSNNEMKTLNIHACPSLYYFICKNNLLGELDLTEKPNIRDLYCNNNKLTQLKIHPSNKLINLDCSHNLIDELDLSGLPSIKNITIVNNPMTYLNLRNGSNMEVIGNVTNYTAYPLSLEFICVDETEENRISVDVKMRGNNNTTITRYCSFTPSLPYTTIVGTRLYDPSSRDCSSGNTRPVQYSAIQLIDSRGRSGVYYADTGRYIFYVNQGAYRLKPVFSKSLYFNIHPEDTLINAKGVHDTMHLNFCISNALPLSKVEVSIIPEGPPPRPGFSAIFKIKVKNLGNQIEKKLVHFSYNHEFMKYVHSSWPLHHSVPGFLSWQIDELLPFESKEILVTLKLNRPTDQPPVNGGDIFKFQAGIADDIVEITLSVVNSFDPNDKTCLQGEHFTREDSLKYLDYKIRFENTGNYFAENVVVRDYIDTNYFEISDIQFLESSHPMRAELIGNRMEIIFENIQLPFPPDELRHGWVVFRIKIKDKIEIGNTLENKAEIYFDFNFPIITNIAKTTLVLPSSVSSHKIKSVFIHPNPANELIRFSIEPPYSTFEIINDKGVSVLSGNSNHQEINISHLPSGIYSVKFGSGQNILWTRFVKI